MARKTTFCGELALPRPYVYKSNWCFARSENGKRLHVKIVRATPEEIQDWDEKRTDANGKRFVPKHVADTLNQASKVANVATTKEQTTVAILVERYRLHYSAQVAQGQLEPATQEKVFYWLDRFAEKYGESAIGEISLTTLEQLWSANPTWAIGTFKKVRSSVRAMLEYARKINVLKDNPLASGAKLATAARTFVLTDKHIETVVANAHESFARFFRFCSLTGTRPSEAAALNRSNVQPMPDGGYVATLTEWKNARKTGKKRLIPVVGDAAKLLADLLATAGDDESPLFKSERGQAFHPHLWSQTLVRIKVKTKLPDDLDMYSTRSYSITKMLARGVDPYKVALVHGTSVKTIEKHYDRNNQDVSAVYAMAK